MKTILVAVDAAPSAREVLELAADLARGTGARLVLFRAGDVPGDLLATQETVEGQRFVARIQEEVRTELAALARAYQLPAATELRVDAGPAVPGLLKAAAEEQAELILVGAHGFGQMSGALGTVTMQLLEHAPCSVLVVRAPRPAQLAATEPGARSGFSAGWDIV